MQTKAHINFDPAFRWLTLASGLAILFLVGSICYTLVVGAMPALKKFGFGFLISQSWDPAFMEFGALSSVYGTLVSTAIGMLIAVPLS
ncbi:MAG: phosphate ABC transporter permease subunit PstC, partial [Deltaproteobacteria bacterium]